MADFFSDETKNDVEKPEEIKETLSEDDNEFEMDDWGNETFVDEATEGQTAENEMTEMPEQEPQAPVAAATATKAPPKKDLDFDDAKRMLNTIDGFDNSAELASKKNSKDGYMDAVVRSVAQFRGVKDRVYNAEKFDKDGANELMSAASHLSDSASEYVRNKNPFFKKGQRRKALVEKIMNAADAIVTTPERFIRVLKVFKTQVEFDADTNAEDLDDKVKQNLAKIESAEKAYTTERDKMFNDREMSGVREGTRKRQTGSTAAALSKIGGLSGDALKSTVTDFQNGIDESKQEDDYDKTESAKAIERVMEMYEKENISDYIKRTPAEMFQGDFEHRLFLCNAAFDMSERAIGAYLRFLKEGVPGMKYNKDTAIDAITRLYFFEMVGSLLHGMSTVMESPVFKQKGPGVLNLLMWNINDLADLLNYDQGSGKDPMRVLFLTSLMAVKQSMNNAGFRFGMSAESAYNTMRQRTVEEFQAVGLR